MAARYLEVRETDDLLYFRVHLDTSQVNANRRPDRYWVIERTYLKDMPLEEIEADLAGVVQFEIQRRQAIRGSGHLVPLSATFHPLSGKMV
jgi:hypothetical protein